MRRLRSCLTFALALSLVFALAAPAYAGAAAPPAGLLLGPNSALLAGRALRMPSLGMSRFFGALAPASVSVTRAATAPHFTTEPTRSTAPHPTASGIRVQSLATLEVGSWAVYSDGYWTWADGLITNPGPDAVTSVTVTAVFLDPVGNELGREDIVPQVDVLDPGASAAFTWAFLWWDAAPPAGTSSYRFEASGVTEPGTSAVLLSTEIVNTTTDSDGWRHYTVRVTNDHADDVTATVVTGYETLAGDGTFVDGAGSYGAFPLRLTPGAYADVDVPGGAPASGALNTPVLRAEGQYATLAPGINMYEPFRTCGYGGTASADGRVLDASLAAVASVTVSARTSIDGGHTWKSLAPTVSDGTGRFAFAVKPSQATLVKVSSPGLADSVITVNQLAALSSPSHPARAATGRAFTVTGTLKPLHKAGSKAVRIETAYIDANLVQTAGPTYWAKATTYKKYSKYAGSVTLKQKGLWLLRASVPGDTLHATTVTAWQTVWVGDTTLSLAKSTGKVSYAKAATLTATIKDVTKHGLKSKQVSLEVYDPTADAFAVVKTVSTNSAGVAKFSVKPELGATYKVVFAGDGAAWGCESGAVGVASSAQGVTASGSGYTKQYKLAAGWHQVVMYNASDYDAYFGLVNSSATKVVHAWTARAQSRAGGKFRLTKAGTYRLAASTSDDTQFVLFVW